jgi:hypothetical protein
LDFLRLACLRTPSFLAPIYPQVVGPWWRHARMKNGALTRGGPSACASMISWFTCRRVSSSSCRRASAPTRTREAARARPGGRGPQRARRHPARHRGPAREAVWQRPSRRRQPARPGSGAGKAPGRPEGGATAAAGRAVSSVRVQGLAGWPPRGHEA